MSERVLSDTIIRVVAKDPSTCVELELAAQEVGARVVSCFCPQLTHVVLVEAEDRKQIPSFITDSSEILVVSADWILKCREQHIRYEEFAFSQDEVPLDKTTEFHEEHQHENEHATTRNPADTSLDDMNLDHGSSQVRFDDMLDGPKGDQMDFNPPPSSYDRGSADIFSPVIVETDVPPPVADEKKEEPKAVDRSLGALDEPSSEAPVSFGSRGAVNIVEDDEPLLYHDDKKKNKEDQRRVSFPQETVVKDLEKTKEKEPKKKRGEKAKIAELPKEEDSASAGLNTSDASWDGSSAKQTKPPSKTAPAKEKKTAAVAKEGSEPEVTPSPAKKKGKAAPKSESSPNSAPRTPRVKKAAAAAASAVAPLQMTPLDTKSESKEEETEKSPSSARSSTPTRRNSRRKTDVPATAAVGELDQPDTPQRSVRRATSNASPTTDPAASKAPAVEEDTPQTPSPPKPKKVTTKKQTAPKVAAEPEETVVQPDTPKSKKRSRKQPEPAETKDIDEASPPKRQKRKETEEASKPEASPSTPVEQEAPAPKKQAKRKRAEEPQALVEQNENQSPAKKAKSPKAKSGANGGPHNIVLSSCTEETKTKAIEFVSSQVGATITGSVTPTTNFVVLGGKKRTLKTVLGIANGAWLVKSSWIDSCVNEGRWCDPAEYEATEWFPGAHRARTAGSAGKIFGRLKFFLHGDFEISHDELRSVISLAGGSVVSAPMHAQYVISGGRRKFTPDPGNALESHLKVRSLEWVMDSVTDWSLKD